MMHAPHLHLRWLLLGLVGSALAMESGCDAAARATSAARPLYVHTAGYPDLASFKNNIQMSADACRMTLGLPPAAVSLPPDATLSSFAVHEDEQWFDGDRWTHYEVDRTISADVTQQCRLMAFSSRSAEVATTCARTQHGANPPLTLLLDMEHPAPAQMPQLESNETRTPDCEQAPAQHSIAGLPLDEAGNGVHCVWNSALIAAAAGQASVDSSDDVCLYDRQPFRQTGGFERPVIVKTRASMQSMTGARIDALNGEFPGHANAKLVSLSDGQAIPSERFSPAAALAFLRQPIKAPVGTP
jgi:hypothetical protein